MTKPFGDDVRGRLRSQVSALATGAALDPSNAAHLLAQLVIETLDGERSRLDEYRLVIANDRDEALSATTAHAERTATGWTLNGRATSLGEGVTSCWVLVRTLDDGGGLLASLDSAPPIFEDFAVAQQNVVMILDASGMDEVRHVIDVAVIATLVGVADALRAGVIRVLSSIPPGRSQRWAAQSLKHRLADAAMRRDVAWLEMAQALEGDPDAGAGFHEAVGLHEALLAATSSMELHAAVCDDDADLLKGSRELVALLERLVGGQDRLKDRVFASSRTGGGA